MPIISNAYKKKKEKRSPIQKKKDCDQNEYVNRVTESLRNWHPCMSNVLFDFRHMLISRW